MSFEIWGIYAKDISFRGNVRKRVANGQTENRNAKKCPQEDSKRTNREPQCEGVSARGQQTDKPRTAIRRSVRKRAANGQTENRNTKKCPQEGSKRTN